MKDYSSTKAQNNFGAILKEINKEAVGITSYNKRVAVILSEDDFQALVRHNDVYWEKVAREALAEGFISEEEMIEWLAIKLSVHFVDVKNFIANFMLDSHSSRSNSTGYILKISTQAKIYMDRLTDKKFLSILSKLASLPKIDSSSFNNYLRYVNIFGYRITYDQLGDFRRIIYIRKE
jgi:prevent-host-death family protein